MQPRKLSRIRPPKRDHFKTKVVFQASFVRGYVSFRGSATVDDHQYGYDADPPKNVSWLSAFWEVII